MRKSHHELFFVFVDAPCINSGFQVRMHEYMPLVHKLSPKKIWPTPLTVGRIGPERFEFGGATANFGVVTDFGAVTASQIDRLRRWTKATRPLPSTSRRAITWNSTSPETILWLLASMMHVPQLPLNN